MELTAAPILKNEEQTKTLSFPCECGFPQLERRHALLLRLLVRSTPHLHPLHFHHTLGPFGRDGPLHKTQLRYPLIPQRAWVWVFSLHTREPGTGPHHATGLVSDIATNPSIPLPDDSAGFFGGVLPPCVSQFPKPNLSFPMEAFAAAEPFSRMPSFFPSLLAERTGVTIERMSDVAETLKE